MTEGPTNMYAIWNVASGNLLGQYANERDALDAVGRLLIANGVDYARELVLARDDVDGLPESIDAGLSLAQRTLAASYETASYLASSSVVSGVARAGISEGLITSEWITGITFHDNPVNPEFEILSSSEYATRWSARAPVASSQPAEGNRKPALAPAA